MKRSDPSRGKLAPAPLPPHVQRQQRLGRLLRPADVIPALDWPICRRIDGDRWFITRDLDLEGGNHE